ncbi:MAG TPA: hypothetical protein VGK61_03735 [Planctomycetota bacterium]|jgi:hypothetical protein
MTEIDEIRTKYESGELDYIKADLERFIIAHAQEIERYRRDQVERGLPPIADDTAIKFFIIQNRSINPEREILEQVAEIEREKWIQGVKTGSAPDPQAVCQEWASKYSAGWRSHRVTSIVYVFEREKDRYLRILRESACAPG